MGTLELINDFHNTAVRVKTEIGQHLTLAQIRRIKAGLCGMDDCCCGTVRGDQPYRIDDDGDGRFRIVRSA